MGFQMTKIALATALVMTLGACTVSGPTVRLKSPLEVKVGVPAQKHCPPGQAKKGNC